MMKLFKDLLTSDGKKLSLGRMAFCIAFIVALLMYIFTSTIAPTMVTLLGLLLGYGSISKKLSIKNGFNSIKKQYKARD